MDLTDDDVGGPAWKNGVEVRAVPPERRIDAEVAREQGIGTAVAVRRVEEHVDRLVISRHHVPIVGDGPRHLASGLNAGVFRAPEDSADFFAGSPAAIDPDVARADVEPAIAGAGAVE